MSQKRKDEDGPRIHRSTAPKDRFTKHRNSVYEYLIEEEDDLYADEEYDDDEYGDHDF